MDKTKSKKVITIVLVISILLALFSIATAYYYFQIRDVTPKGSSAAEGCGCYYAKATEAVTSCTSATPENAFAFKTGFKDDNGTCSATCDERDAPSIRTAQGETPTILLCKVDTFPANPGCIDVAILDADGKRIADQVSPTESVKLQAVFRKPNTVTSDEEYFKSYSFVVNGEKTEINKESAEVTGSGVDALYTISTQLTEYGDANKLTVQAFATSVTNSDITSGACLRSININRPKEAACTKLDLDVTADTKATVNEVKIETGGLTTVNSLTVKFKMGTDGKALTTKEIKTKYVDGTIILDKSFLYNKDNFTTADSFAFFDKESNSIELASTVVVNGKDIESSACEVSEKISLNTPSDNDGTNGGNDTDNDNDNETPSGNNDGDDDDNETPSGNTGEKSSFVVSKQASKQCIERTGTNNTVDYTISVKNNDTAYEDITSVKDKLPLGFTYVAGSSEINGTAVADNSFITVTTVGSTQELVWQTTNGWSIKNGDTFTIKFRATATSSALTGANLNEVVVTPVNTPTDATTLRSEVSINVQQSCTAPQTGIFDSTIAKVVAGLVVIILAAVFYNSQTGEQISENFISNPVYESATKSMRLLGLKLTEPKKYFEEKSLHSIEKKRKRKN